MRLLFILIFLIASNCYAQKPAWVRNSDTPPEVNGYGYTDSKQMAVHPDGSIFVLGHYGGTNTLNDGTPLVELGSSTYDHDAFMAKYNGNGDLLWVKKIFTYAGSYLNVLIDIKVDNAGDLVFTGSCTYPASILGSAQGQGVFIAKMDKDANLIWLNFESSVSLSDSNVITWGNRIGFDHQQNILWYTDQISSAGGRNVGGLAVIKYAPDGTKLSNMFVTQNPNDYHPTLTDFAVDGDGNFIVGGYFQISIALQGGPSLVNSITASYSTQFFLAKFSPGGNFLWTVHSNDGDRGNSMHALTVDPQGNIYFGANVFNGTAIHTSSGTYTSNSDENFIAQLTPDGKLKWKNQLNNCHVSNFHLAPDGLIYVTGSSYRTFQYQSYVRPTSPTWGFVLKINTDGNFYGALHGAAMGNLQPRVYPRHSVVDIQGNIYTLGRFGEGQYWGCLATTTSGVESFFLVKHTPVESPVLEATCNGSSITLTTALVPNAVYKWFIPGEPSPVGVLEQNSITLQLKSEYAKQPIIVSVNDNNCNEYFTKPFILTLPPKPQLITGKDFVCPGTSEDYSITEIGSENSYAWTLPRGVTSTNLTPSGATLSFDEDFSAGTVKVTTTNTCGSADLEFNIGTYNSPLAPALEGDETICNGENYLQKSVSAVSDVVSYQWELPPFISFDPAYSPTANVLHVNVFPEFQSGEIKVRAVGHCDVSEPSVIKVNRPANPEGAQPLTGATEICASDRNTIRYSVPPIPNAVNYVWHIPDFFGISGEKITDTPYVELVAINAGSGEIRVYGSNNCQANGEPSTLSVASYEALPTPVLTLNECENEVHIEGNGQFNWFRNGIPSSSFDDDRQILLDAGVYYAVVSNFCGVKQSNSITANPVIPSNLTIPNVITPDGDKKNDFFVIDESLKNVTLEISNRWGNRVYFSSGYQNTWNGDGLSPGIYFYVLYNRCLPHPYKGTIDVVR
jgi:hypothetical protein